MKVEVVNRCKSMVGSCFINFELMQFVLNLNYSWPDGAFFDESANEVVVIWDEGREPIRVAFSERVEITNLVVSEKQVTATVQRKLLTKNFIRRIADGVI